MYVSMHKTLQYTCMCFCVKHHRTCMLSMCNITAEDLYV